MVVKLTNGLGSCNLNAEKMAPIAQRSALAVDGQELAVAGLQKGRITADCLVGLKTDAERRPFFIDNTNWFFGWFLLYAGTATTTIPDKTAPGQRHTAACLPAVAVATPTPGQTPLTRGRVSVSRFLPSPSLPSVARLRSARFLHASLPPHRRPEHRAHRPPPMGTPRRPRPRQLARTNAMRNSSYSAEAGADGDDEDLVAYAAAGGGFASQTSFRISGGRGGAEEVAELFRKLGLSGPEDFAIPPAIYAAAMSHLPNATRRRASLEESPRAGAEASSSSSPPDVPETSGRDVAVTTRLQTAGEGEEAVLATESVQPEITQVSARTYQEPGAESKSRLEIVETSTSKVTAAPKPGNAGEEKGNDKPAKVETLRKERRRELVAVETTRETTGGALAVVVAESTSADVEHLVSPSPHRRFRRTITSWIKGGHIGSGSFGSVYEAISDDGFFFAVKEVSLVDQGINAKQRIVQLEHEVSLLSRLEHDNIVQYYGTDKVVLYTLVPC
ncbi:hypothetical protein ACQ4PT_012274 [Festuca glaucescens]